jgi:hypothetical protein
MASLTRRTSVAEGREEEEEHNNTADLGLASRGGEDLTITTSRFVGTGVLFLVDGCLVFAFFAIIFNLIKKAGGDVNVLVENLLLEKHSEKVRR